MFPAMMRYALPGIGNNWQVILKSTALVSLLGLPLGIRRIILFRLPAGNVLHSAVRLIFYHQTVTGHGLGALSYTHLDVYKRQLSNNC